MHQAWSACGVRDVIVTRATAAMLASASPRQPSVATRSRSASAVILLVAWRASASGRSSCAMPLPSSVTRIRFVPPCSSITLIARAPASRLFSSNSFTTEAGRSTTSPAAIWLISVSGRIRMTDIAMLLGDFGHCAATDAHELSGCQSEDRVWIPAGGPDFWILQQVAVDQRTDLGRMTDRRNAADHETGRCTHELRACFVDRFTDQRCDAAEIDSIGAAGHDEQRASGLRAAEHERIGDLRDATTDLLGRGAGGAGSRGQLDDLRVNAGSRKCGAHALDARVIREGRLRHDNEFAAV